MNVPLSAFSHEYLVKKSGSERRATRLLKDLRAADVSSTGNLNLDEILGEFMKEEQQEDISARRGKLAATLFVALVLSLAGNFALTTMQQGGPSAPRGLCTICGKPLVPVGHARRGGKDHADWESRSTHKACWAKRMREEGVTDYGDPSELWGGPKRQRTPASSWRPRATPTPEELALTANAPNCSSCGLKTVWNTSRTEANPNRRFYACDNQCHGAFRWIDMPPSPRGGGSSGGAGPSSSSGAGPSFTSDPTRTLAERLRDASQEGDLRAVRECIHEARYEHDVEAVGGGMVHMSMMGHIAHSAINATGGARNGSKPATPLRFAAFHGWLGIVSELLTAGALVRLADADGNDALDLARIGRGHFAAKGPRSERDAVIAKLSHAHAAETFVIRGVDKERFKKLNGLEVEVTAVLESGKWTASEFNGAAVTVLRFENGRHIIRFMVDGPTWKAGKELRIKPENLQKIGEASPGRPAARYVD